LSIFPGKPKPMPDIPMREFLERIIDERDRLYAVRFEEAKTAVNAALIAQKESVTSAFLASEKAIVKAEEAQAAYNVAHNDLSRKLDEQNKATIPRPEINALFIGVDQKLEAIRASLDKDIETLSTDIRSLRESRSETGGIKAGNREIIAYLIAGASIILALVLHFIPA
jgi:hypothetical protein